MPGIVGLITKLPRQHAEASLARMLNAQLHESFYTSGTWSDEGLGAYVGWTAIEKSFADGMPVTSGQGDVSLIFAGEEYPDSPCAGKPCSGGPGYLLRRYEENPDFLRGLNGLFHGLLADRNRDTVTLFNDRYGMRRIYYHQTPDAFYFAAEAKALLAVLPNLREFDPQGLGEFVACSCVLEDRTIFKGIRTLPGGSAWSFRDGKLEERKTYFDPKEWEQQSPLDPETFYQQLREGLVRNLPRYFGGPQAVAMALTGGLDTRVLMGLHRATPGSLPCYTFGSMYRDNHDVRLARKIAAVCQQPHQVLTVGNEFLDRFPHYAERSVYLTEGGVDVYRASDLYVSELARQIAPVKVVGTYGSEIVRHAVMFKPMPPAPGLYQNDLMGLVKRAGETYSTLRRQNPVTFAAFRQSPWYHSGILSLEQSQLTVRSPYLDNDFVQTIFRAPQSDDDVRLQLIRGGDPVLAGIPTDRGVGGDSGPLQSAISRALLEFTFKAEYAYDYGMPQPVVKVDRTFSALHLERLFLGRHKLLHFRLWYRDALSKYVREMLLDPRTLSRPFVDRKGVEAAVEGHLSGRLNSTTSIHKLLTVELLHRQFADAQ